ncbi:MAG: type II toxin-antitoxin system Phd/YefM family antitoxin [Pirellulales bacterium]
MKTASITEMQRQFKDFVQASEAGPIVVTDAGRPVAVLVGIEDEDDVERLLMGCSPQLRAILDRSWAQIQGQGIPHDEFWKRAEARASAKQLAGRKGKKPRKR